MKALILNFQNFDSKDGSKNFHKFDMYDLESKSLYNIFVDSHYCAVPGGEVPNKDFFPCIADVDFEMTSYTDKKTNRLTYAPRVNGIKTWKHVDIK